MTYVMALVGVAVLVSAWGERQVAVTIPMLATALFGGLGAIMAVTAGARMSDPLAYSPIYFLIGLAALNAAAAATARA